MSVVDVPRVAALVLALGSLIGGPISVSSAADERPDSVHVHASQRFDRSIALLVRDVRRHTRPPVDLLTLTEVQERARRVPLHHVDGWNVRTGQGTDLAIMWRLSRWKLRASGVRPLTSLTYVGWSGRPVRQRMMFVVLDPRPPRTAPRLLVTLAHLPSAVEYGDSFRRSSPSRVAVWKDSLPGWRNAIRELRTRFRPSVVMIVADWNVDVRRPHWRRVLADAFPHQRLTWRRPLPTRGTHAGGRLIDATLTNAHGRAVLRRHTAASDHTPYVERLWK